MRKREREGGGGRERGRRGGKEGGKRERHVWERCRS